MCLKSMFENISKRIIYKTFLKGLKQSFKNNGMKEEICSSIRINTHNARGQSYTIFLCLQQQLLFCTSIISFYTFMDVGHI